METSSTADEISALRARFQLEHDVPGYTLDRVHAALRGEFDADQLSPDEEVLFADLFANYLMQPNPENEAFVAKMFAEGGYIGEDEQGRLVRTLPGGGLAPTDTDSY